MTNLSCIDNSSLAGHIRPRAQETRLLGFAGTVAGLFLMAGVPHALHHFRWKVGLPLTAASVTAAILGEHFVHGKDIPPEDAARRNLRRRALHNTPIKGRRDYSATREWMEIKKRINGYQALLQKCEAEFEIWQMPNINHVLGEDFDLERKFLLELGDWINDLAQLGVDGLKEEAAAGYIFLPWSGTPILEVKVVGSEKVIEIASLAGTLQGVKDDKGMHVLIDYSAANAYGNKENTKVRIHPICIIAIAWGLLAEEWEGEADVKPLTESTPARWGVTLKAKEADVLMLTGGPSTLKRTGTLELTWPGQEESK